MKPIGNSVNRIVYIDMARAFAIFLVVLGHTGYISSTTNIWLSTIHLPVFFGAAGVMLFLGNTTDKPFAAFAKRKLISVMVPYYFFSATYYLLYLLAHTAHNFTGDNLRIFLLQVFTLRGYATLWFLPVFLIGEIISFLCIKHLKGKVRLIVTILIFTVLTTVAGNLYTANREIYCVGMLNTALYEMILTLIKSVCAAVFILIGYLLAPIITNAERDKRKDLIAGIILMAINVLCTGINGIQDLNNINCGFLPLYYVLGTIGFSGVLLICKCLPKWKWLAYFGCNSIIIMATHLSDYILYLAMVFSSHFSTRMPVAKELTQLILTMTFTFLFSVPVIEILNRYFPYLIGRRKA